jgi:phosphoglucosamine mutase
VAKLFGSSGVRGLVNNFLTPKLACKIGLAVASHIKAKKALVARDTRVSGHMIENALVSGLLACGVKVTLLGVVPTPVLAYSTMKLNADVGFMLTASHNPPQYNGIKIFDGKSLSYSDESQYIIEKLMSKDRYKLANWRQISTSSKADIAHLYMEMVQKTLPLRKNWHVVVDPGCGATFDIGPRLLKNSGCIVTSLNAQPDGFFPSRKSEPNAESLMDLIQIVKNVNADIGIAFDGDGDRVAFVDEKGSLVDLDRSLAAYAAYSLRQSEGDTIVTNVEASMCVETMARKLGGKVIRTKVGDVYISGAIKQYGAVFGGEPCGAWVHPRFHYCPDGPLSSVLLLKALEEEEVSLHEFVSEVPEYVTLRENLNCSNAFKDNLVLKVEKNVEAEFPKNTGFSKVDGIRLTLSSGWLLIRASGTEPLLRVTVEGESLKAAKDIMRRVKILIRKQIKELQK